MIELFWKMPIDFESEHLEIDKSPFSITQYAPMAKVHFIFAMMTLSQLFVIDEGRLVGLITKSSFIK